jgi:hypothetical protein
MPILQYYGYPNYLTAHSETVSLLAVKAVLVPQIAKNLPDSFVNQNPGWAGFKTLLPGSTNAVLIPVSPNYIKYYTKYGSEVLLPLLIRDNWITYNPSEGIYHLTYGDKGLDHTIYDQTTIADWVLLNTLIPYQKALGIPDSEMNQLLSLTHNVSGSETSISNLNTALTIGSYIAAALIIGYGAVSAPVALSTVPATSGLATVGDISYLGAGTITSSITEGSLAASAATGAPLTYAGAGTIAGSVTAGGVGASIAGGITGAESLLAYTPIAGGSGNVINLANSIPGNIVQEVPVQPTTFSSLLDQTLQSGEKLTGSVATAKAKQLINQALGGDGGVGTSQIPQTHPETLFSGSTGVMILGLGFLAFLVIKS